MMNIERANAIATIIEDKTGLEVQAMEVRKGDFMLMGISIGEQGSRIKPTIYVDKMEEMSDEEIATEVVNIYERSTNYNINFNPESFRDYEKVKSGLRICIRPKTNNPDDIKRDFLDLEQYVRYYIADVADGTATITIKKSLIETWGVDEDTVFADAYANMSSEYNDNYTISDMQDVLLNLMMNIPYEQKTAFDFIDNLDCSSNIPMYIFSNFSKTNGATGICSTEILSAFADKLESDVYIIPSSIHELILVPVNMTSINNIDELKDMIQEINAKEVKPEDVLSDHPYLFVREKREVIAA